MNQPLKTTLYWTLNYRNDSEFSQIRFKRLKQDKYHYDFIDDWIDVVTPEDFFTHEPDRLPLFIGSQFGIWPYLNKYEKFMDRSLRIAILGKSMLSGCVSGLRVQEVNLVPEDPERLHYTWKVIQQIRYFPNQPPEQ